MIAMKMNLKVRLKNPWFWIGLGGVILTAMGINPEDLTSWGAVYVALESLLGNPFMLFSVAVAVLGVFIDPTTGGVTDSDQAMTYSSPKRD